MIKEIILWTIIILIAFFIFSGGGETIFNFIEGGYKEIKERVSNESYSNFPLNVSCMQLKNGIKFLGDWISYNDAVEYDCINLCLESSQEYSSNKCINDNIICRCVE